MNVQTVSIDEIKVAERRREEFGDLHGLAASIEKYGLLQPIVIDSDNNLVAGERRLRAFQILERSDIPCRIFEELTPQERLEMELEENNQRLDLTPLERNKRLLQSAETIEERISSTIDQIKPDKSAGRKPERSVPKKDIADALGVSKATLINAEQHVAAVESYPELKSAPQKQAIETAKTLDKMPEEKREAARQNISQIKKPLPKPGISKGGGQFNKWNTRVRDFKSELKDAGSIENLTGSWTESERFSFFDNLRELRDLVDEYTIDLGEHLNELKEAS